MPDRLFADRRLAGVYDPLDPDRSDLEVYAVIAVELGARTVLDLGCGTGTFAVMLGERGLDVTGVDPAARPSTWLVPSQGPTRCAGCWVRSTPWPTCASTW